MKKVFTLWKESQRSHERKFWRWRMKARKSLQIKWELKSSHTHLISENFWKGSSWEKQRARNQNKAYFLTFPCQDQKNTDGGKSIIWGWCEHTNWQAGEWVTEGTYKVNNIPSAGRNYLHINHSPSGKGLEHLPAPQWP